MEISVEQRLVWSSPDAVSCELAGESVILDMASGRYFALDPIGSLIWNSLQTPCTAGSICDRLLEAYEVDPEQCRSDVTALLNQLAEHGLIRFEDVP